MRIGGPVEEAAALVRVLAGAPTEEDEDALRAANRAGVPVVAVQTGSGTFDVPYVLATDVVVVPPGSGFPVDEIARALARRLGDRSLGLAARLPVLREPVCEALIERFSRKNGILGVAIFVPGADLPVLTLNQLRLVLRLAAAHGVEVDQQRLPEVLGTIGAGFGFRAVARQALGVLPVAGWARQGRGRLRGHARDRRGGRALLRAQRRRRIDGSVRSGTYSPGNRPGGRRDGRCRARRRAADDRGGRRLVRVPRGDARSGRAALRARSSPGPGPG